MSEQLSASAWNVEPELPENFWKFGSLLVLLVATAFRLSALELNPLHHDEGVNGFFLTSLLREGVYHYDPSNYHGPTLYYLTLPFVALFGLHTFVIRLVPVLFGIGIVALVLCLRRYLGTLGALVAAALVAVSPGAIYNSRYFIHESLFVFFTVGIVVAALRFYETKQAQYLLLAAASAGLLFATKETHFISVAVLVLAAACGWGYALLFRAPQRSTKTRVSAYTPPEGFVSQMGGSRRLAILVAAALVIFLGINVLFYSSFFTYAKGVSGALESLMIWTRTGTSEFHRKPPGTYLDWLWQEEAPVLILAVLGVMFALVERPVNRFAIFAGAWAFGLFAAYTMIPYKTPWLMLNFTVPMALIGGYAVQSLYRKTARTNLRHLPALAVAGVALAVCTYQAAVLNFQHYDDDSYPYVYAHTQRGALQLVETVKRLAERAGTGKETNISIASPDYWPLPWYFREYTHVGYGAAVSPSYDANALPIVIGKKTQEKQFEAALGGNYLVVGSYVLRPGVDLIVYARRDLASR